MYCPKKFTTTFPATFGLSLTLNFLVVSGEYFKTQNPLPTRIEQKMPDCHLNSQLLKVFLTVKVGWNWKAKFSCPWVGLGVKNFGFTEEQKNIEQGSIKLKELHVCIMRVQKKMAAWRSEVP